MPLKQKLAKVRLPNGAERERMCTHAQIHVFLWKENENIGTLALTKCKVKSTYGLPGKFSCVLSTAIELTLLL